MNVFRQAIGSRPLVTAGLVSVAASFLLAESDTSIHLLRQTSAGNQAAVPRLRYVSGSSVKVEQLLGEEDKQRHQPTLSRTMTRYGIEGTDLGYSFEHAGRVY